MATLIEADILTSLAVFKGVPTHSPAADRDPDLDITFNCTGRDANGNPNQGVLFAYATISGEIPFVDFDATLTAISSISGTPVWGNVYEATITSYAKFSADLLLENLKSNWVMWSKIGQMDFTIDRKNTAGERPMDWSGWVYCVKKLGSKVVAYGENGVSFMIPSGVTYGLQTVHRVGLKSKLAIAGTDDIHFFIDNKDQLFSLSDGLEKLDYSEYLSVLTSPVLSYDIESNLLYICDGTYGFVYSPIDKSLGEGPVNITGISSQGGTLYAVSPAAIIIPAFEICTDIYDFGTRHGKTIYYLEIGTDIEGTLQAAIDYRLDKAESFTKTSYYDVDRRGQAHITAYGREFRFWVKNLEYEYFEVDWIAINGEIDNH